MGIYFRRCPGLPIRQHADRDAFTERHTLINHWVNQWAGPIDPQTAPVQALEITPDQKIVWALRSWTNPDLGPSTTIQLLDDREVPEAVHFGSIR